MNKEEKRIYQSNYYQEHREYMLEQRKRWRKNNPEKKKECDRRWRKNNPEKDRERSFKYYKNLKEKCLFYYSNSPVPFCKCCYITDINILTIDHIGGGGKEHRKKLNIRGAPFYRWLIKNNFPEGYQVLCYNCNLGKRNRKICPHILTKMEVKKRLSINYYKNMRIPILKKFSNGDIKCVSCNENNILFLAVDHINGGGRKNIESFKATYYYNKYLKDEALIEDFQVLCHNCNFLKYLSS